MFTQMTHSLQELAAAQGKCSGDGGDGRRGLGAPRRWMCVQTGSPAGVSDPEEVVPGSRASLVGVGEKGWTSTGREGKAWCRHDKSLKPPRDQVNVSYDLAVWHILFLAVGFCSCHCLLLGLNLPTLRWNNFLVSQEGCGMEPEGGVLMRQIPRRRSSGINAIPYG